MACNFWQSTHKREMDRINSDDFRSKYEKMVEREVQDHQIAQNGARLLPMYLTQIIFKCASRLDLRVQVAATASVFMKRYFLRCGLSSCNPRSVAPACLLLACKVEEYPERYAVGRKEKENMRDCVARCWNETVEHDSVWRDFRVSAAELMGIEFVIVDVMCDSMQVFHPYAALTALLEDAGQQDLLDTAWSCVNDAYVSDVVLLWPPHIVAVACVSIAAIVKGVDLRQWQASLNCDTQQVGKVMMEILESQSMLGEGFSSEVKQIMVSCDKHFR
eukprot:TRINITY_DN44932_c0_g1_i1.p1 TRINITY_DN44932_c0_g1~~TRINITY_DN44932_c0_g1_i1.p1  ORF type:complete len:275 (-),score=53.25 TRINITY_DN44932_c0_g1_i1:364-1188(-)